jgi:hypothetical protein
MVVFGDFSCSFSLRRSFVVAGGFRLIGKPPKNTFCQRHSCGRKRALLPKAFLGAFGSFFPTDVEKKKMNNHMENRNLQWLLNLIIYLP